MWKRKVTFRSSLAAVAVVGLLMTSPSPASAAPRASRSISSTVSFAVSINSPLAVGYHQATELVITVTKGYGLATNQYMVLTLPRVIKRAIMSPGDESVVSSLSSERIIFEHTIDPNDGPSVAQYHYYIYGVRKGRGLVSVTTFSSAIDPDFRDNTAATSLQVD